MSISLEQPQPVRIAWIDTAKLIGIYLVVLGHLPLRGESNGTSLVLNFIAAFHMPLFFFLSGFVEKNRSVKDTFVRSVKGLLIPYVCMYLLTYLWWLFVSYLRHPEEFGRSFFTGCIEPLLGMVFSCHSSVSTMLTSPLWFLVALFWCRLLYAWGTKTRQVVSILFCVFGISFSIYLWSLHKNIQFFTFAPLCMGFPFYYTGALVQKYRGMDFFKQERPIIIRLLFAVISFVILCAVTYFNGEGVGIYGVHYGNSPVLFYIGAYSGICMLCAFSSLFPPLCSFLRMLAQNTIVILAWHTIIQGFVKKFYARLFLHLPSLGDTELAFFSGIAIALISLLLCAVPCYVISTWFPWMLGRGKVRRNPKKKRYSYVLVVFLCLCVACSNDNDSDSVVETTVNFIEGGGNTGLPTLSISTGSVSTSAITKKKYVNAQYTMQMADEDAITVSLPVSIKGRGNSTWLMPKKGYNLKFEKKQSLCGLPAAKKWCLIANFPDKSLVRNLFVSLLGNTILTGLPWTPHFIPVDLILNGDYRGTYLLGEKITLTEGRVDIPDGGFILEVDARLDADFYFLTKRGVCVTLKDPDTVSSTMQTSIKDIVQTAEDTLYGDGFADGENGWRHYIDETALIDWFIANELTKNNDAAFAFSVYMYYDPADAKLHFGPLWDYDTSCGNINYNGADIPYYWHIRYSLWIQRLFEDPLFVAHLQARWDEVSADIARAINTQIQSMADTLAASADFNFKKWLILGKYVMPNADGYETRLTYQSEVDYLIQWLTMRFNWLDGAIRAL